MNQLIVFAAKYLFLVSVIAVIIYLVRLPRDSRVRLALTLILGGLIALVLAKLSGKVISDPRPFVVGHFTPLIPHSNDNGFPSDHTLITSLIGFAVLPFSKKLGGALLGVALVVGASRVAAGIHHPLDILGAFVITGVSVLAAGYAVKRWQEHKAPKPADEH